MAEDVLSHSLASLHFNWRLPDSSSRSPQWTECVPPELMGRRYSTIKNHTPTPKSGQSGNILILLTRWAIPFAGLRASTSPWAVIHGQGCPPGLSHLQIVGGGGWQGGIFMPSTQMPLPGADFFPMTIIPVLFRNVMKAIITLR